MADTIHPIWEHLKREKVGVLSPKSGGYDAVSEAWIRFVCEAVEIDCPLHYDAETAKAHGYKDVVAPPFFASIASIDPYWLPEQEPMGEDPISPGIYAAQLGIPSINGFVTDVTLHCEAPIYPGDKVSRASRLTKVVPKKLKISNGAFITVEDVMTGQDGEQKAIFEYVSFLGV